MARRVTLAVCGIVAIGLAACSERHEVRTTPAQLADPHPCPPKLELLTRLEEAVTANDISGVTARAAVPHLKRLDLPSTGYYVPKASHPYLRDRPGWSFLVHESGFTQPCAVGNASGIDITLEIDPTTGQATRFELSE
jgi:hypothetical protein